MSFYGYMRSIGFGLIIFTIRNVSPIFDPEKRRSLMGQGPWNFLVLLQGLSTLINLMLVNNLFDNTLLFEVLMTLIIFSGLVFAMYTTEELK